VTRTRLLLIVAAALLAACAQTPTSTLAPGSARHDGGNSLGSGNYVPTDTTHRGGNSLGSGN
jgi:hypothetical protein